MSAVLFGCRRVLLGSVPVGHLVHTGAAFADPLERTSTRLGGRILQSVDGWILRFCRVSSSFTMSASPPARTGLRHRAARRGPGGRAVPSQGGRCIRAARAARLGRRGGGRSAVVAEGSARLSAPAHCGSAIGGQRVLFDDSDPIRFRMCLLRIRMQPPSTCEAASIWVGEVELPTGQNLGAAGAARLGAALRLAEQGRRDQLRIQAPVVRSCQRKLPSHVPASCRTEWFIDEW